MGSMGNATGITHSKQQVLNSFHHFLFFSLFLSCFLLQHIFGIFGLGLALGPGLWIFYTVRERSKYQNLFEQMTPVLDLDYINSLKKMWLYGNDRSRLPGQLGKRASWLHVIIIKMGESGNLASLMSGSMHAYIVSSNNNPARQVGQLTSCNNKKHNRSRIQG